MTNGILTNINGVWRNLSTPFVNINGVWRESDVMINAGGVWREQHPRELDESDILGFRLVYKLVEDAYHPEHPMLRTNRGIPSEIRLTGEHVGYMDTTNKGIIFRYLREGYKDDPAYLGWKYEGLLKYEAHLYAVLIDESVVDIISSTTPATERILPHGSIPHYITNKFSKLDITMEAWVVYESYGYYMNGWNSLFNKDQLLDPTRYPNKELHKNMKHLNSYIILPVEKRDKAFDSVASIGIARDMTSEDTNMVGSYGTLTHTIFDINVNGVSKPFVVELYH